MLAVFVPRHLCRATTCGHFTKLRARRVGGGGPNIGDRSNPLCLSFPEYLPYRLRAVSGCPRKSSDNLWIALLVAIVSPRAAALSINHGADSDCVSVVGKDRCICYHFKLW